MKGTKTSINANNGFFSIRETARITGLSEYCLRRMVKAGQIPGVYSGKKFLINLSSFQQMLEKAPVDSMKSE